MAFLSGWSAMLLGQCWEMVLARHERFKYAHCRKPYAEIGNCAFGAKMKVTVSICVNLTQFGAATVFLLLCAKNCHFLLATQFQWNASICALLPLICCLLWPATMLKSPNDFWPILLGGIFCTVGTFLLICLGTLLDFVAGETQRHGKQVGGVYPEFSLTNYLTSFGTMLFAYGGHPVMPSIQHDMRRPSEFGKSVLLAFGVITVFNLTVVILSGFAYGNGVEESVLNSLTTPWIRQLVLLLTTLNSLLSIILVLNPVNQEAEELVGVPQEFGWKRVGIRSFVLLAVLFVAETAPSFGPVLNFFDGSTVASTSLIFPWLFHYALKYTMPVEAANMATGGNKQWLIQCAYAVVIVFAAVLGISVTIAALKELAGVQFVQPCYLRI